MARVLYNTPIFKNISQIHPCAHTVVRNTSVPPNIDSVLLERNLNAAEIIISIPKTARYVADMIGPPHPVSNLRPVIWYRSPTETLLQRKLKDLQEATQAWNQRFWETHNTNFINERKKYLEKNLPDGQQTLTADEMSGFYKEFLDKNWKNHVNYNFEWYKKNFTILLLSILVNIERLFHK